MMNVTLWGVRGSIPTTGSNTKLFGGHTSSVLVSEDDDLLVLDAGSGIQSFNSAQVSPVKRVDILLTHLHMDHIQGLGFFNPFFIPELEVHIWGPASSKGNLLSQLGRYLSPPLFPVRLKELPCKLTLHEVGNTEFQIGHFKIKSSYIIHPGPTLGYRIEGNQSVFAYLPDHEPALARNGIIPDKQWVSGFDIAAYADLLYHDGQYTSDEYAARIGWGHSSLDDVLQFASITETKHLLIGHHDPSHSDARLAELFVELKKSNKLNFQFEMAVEGREFGLA